MLKTMVLLISHVTYAALFDRTRLEYSQKYHFVNVIQPDYSIGNSNGVFFFLPCPLYQVYRILRRLLPSGFYPSKNLILYPRSIFQRVGFVPYRPISCIIHSILSSLRLSTLRFSLTLSPQIRHFVVSCLTLSFLVLQRVCRYMFYH